MAISLPLSTERAYDASGAVIHMGHVLESVIPPMAGYPETVTGIAEAYLNGVADIYGIDQDMLGNVGESPASEPTEAGVRLQIASVRHDFGTATILFAQTCLGLPIWEAGVAVNVAENPLRVTASRSTVHANVQVTPPSPAALASIITPERLRTLLGLGSTDSLPMINGMRLRVYRFDLDKRIQRDASDSSFPDIELPEIPPSIGPESHYVIREVLFSMPRLPHGMLNWRCFIEPESEAVLFLQVFTTGATGKVFLMDPYRQGAIPTDVSAASSEVVLDEYRTDTDVVLEGLGAPVGGVQGLDNADNIFVRVSDFEDPKGGGYAPPQQPSPPASFVYGSKTPEFAAVSAYYHCDRVFRITRDLIGPERFSAFFNGTQFPVSVDHRAVSDQVNAYADGNVTGDGLGSFRFGLSVGGSTLGIATSWTVVCHEFGHAMLWDAIHAPNFGFAHSCGDSIAVILNDPESVQADRFHSFPWERAAYDPFTDDYRRHDRTVGSGWAWGGSRDRGNGDYWSEQILSTTLFRAYRSIGGDSPDPMRRQFAADMMMTIIAEAVRSLGIGLIVATPEPDIFATALMDTDKTLATTVWGGGHVMGAYHKVIRWAFEKQGLYQPAGAPTPVTTAGDPPLYDVYIGDGRNGEYPYQPMWWENPNIWNRVNADGQPGHQMPVLNQTNYVYVRLKNRGAQNVVGAVVKAFRCKPGAGLTWPFDWTQIGPAQGHTAGTVLAQHGNEVIVGPFSWIPASLNHECLLAYVHHPNDPCNAEVNQAAPPPCASGPIPEWRLVPNDNNIGQRNVHPVPGAPGGIAICDYLSGRNWWVKNSSAQTITVHLMPELPQFMVNRGWGLAFTNPGGDSFTLAPGSEQMIGMTCIAGTPFTGAEIPANDRLIRIRVFAEGPNAGKHVGGEMGGMTYEIYPSLG